MKSLLIGLIERGLNKSVSATGLGLFRIAFALVITQEILFLIYFRHLIFDPIPYIESASFVLSIALGLWLGIAICLLCGLFTRYCAIFNYLFWVLFVLLSPMWRDFDGGFDQLMIGSSLILIFVRSERALSLDNLRLQFNTAPSQAKSILKNQVPVIYYWILLGYSLGLLYFDAAINKLHSEIWLNGLGAWVPNTMPYYISPIDLDWFVDSETLQKLVGFSLIGFQLVFLFLFTRRFFRIPLLLFGVLFHLGIVVCLNIYPFGFGMLVHYILLVPFACWRSIASKIRHEDPPLRTYCNLHDPEAFRLAITLRHFDFRNYSEFHFVSGISGLPTAIRARCSDFGAFTLASLDRENKVYREDRGFLKKNYFLLLIGMIKFIDQAQTFYSKFWLRISPNSSALQSKNAQNSRFRKIAAFSLHQSETSAKILYQFVLLVCVLQLNSTIRYGLSEFIEANPQPTHFQQILDETSIYLTSLSHALFGITPHALYMDDHFNGYEQITALSYIDADGKQRWLPFIAPDGRIVAPNWGRVHSMWANVAMHPPFDEIAFERLVKKVTAFWAEKLGIGTRDTIFLVKAKSIQLSYQWIEGLRQQNLSGSWSDFARIRWNNNQFSIEYRNPAH